MIVIGLTGSIGMGKSTAAAALRRLGLPVHDADAAVHRLLAPGGAAVQPVLAAFPDVADPAGGINRQRLGTRVFGDAAALKRLEAILHPRVRAAKRRFLAAQARHRRPMVVLDVPLLYETGGERECDAVLVVSAPAFLQRQRVLARPGMSKAKFRAILGKQMPDREKRRRSSFVIQTGMGRRFSLDRLRTALRSIDLRHRGPSISMAHHQA
ncbi:MAG TPA: dephospho-CoA kinase [Aliidongia sp.]|uniref:dephospho-CoA kinase n=1 Tax=Aliidongia sp. TaxID=1914230 RepID=UPI002DDD4CAC|nr:dephospho-CoA kinase [Aliidongia sp.]HEV2676860.1 dephospho-CoA kinase [Aliidongia sp.]